MANVLFGFVPAGTNDPAPPETESVRGFECAAVNLTSKKGA
jgi:hypothetical protein